MEQTPNELSQLADLLGSQGPMIVRALIALPIATFLGVVLAFRPRRRGTPERSAQVIQTQIMLSVVGAVVMLVVGSSLARAFGIVGAANLIRYRVKIDDPKDAVVMLCTLTLGLTAGVELYGLALVAAVFLMGVLWVIESFEPASHKVFDLKITYTDAGTIRDEIEGILRRNRAKYELRTAGPKELVYEAELPLNLRTDRMANAILALRNNDPELSVVLEEKKKK